MIASPPLALYLHVPWCVRKCPYCDFNSHEAGAAIPEKEYVQALLADLGRDLEQCPDFVQGRQISSIFIGGGTPSLFSPSAYEAIFSGLQKQLGFAPDIEITLEANPGTVEQEKFRGYRALGINRLSIGVQSFSPEKLKALGRIHGRDEALHAAEAARSAGFENFNIDLMHGLPGQSLQEAVADVQQAIDLGPTHLSWYQLTIEPNTVFYRDPPVLPEDDTLWAIQEAGQELLAANGYSQYEVSAYAKAGRECRHNRNYWEFGDYLALGAGAHGKVTRDGGVFRYNKTRLPRDYLAAASTGKFTASSGFVRDQELVFEFMLNALRLREGVPSTLFSGRTGIPLSAIEARLDDLRVQGLLQAEKSRLACTATGFSYLNTVLEEFLAD
ncbi:MAG: radical SAM family heme chaperone HemW [Pedobacter sp.]|nr:radical SAM family heme chaperone HemW [Pedobacter sp.]